MEFGLKGRLVLTVFIILASSIVFVFAVYKKDEKLLNTIGSFGVIISILISCFGIYDQIESDRKNLETEKKNQQRIRVNIGLTRLESAIATLECYSNETGKAPQLLGR